MTPRMMIVDRVMESALNVGDDFVVASCRRLRQANLRGWRRHHNPADMRLVLEVYEMMLDFDRAITERE